MPISTLVIQELRHKLEHECPICGYVNNTDDVVLLNDLESAGHIVHESFQEGGRGYNWRVFVYRIENPETTTYTYFEIKRSTLALDPDEFDEDEQFTIQEVVPELVTRYKPLN